MEVVYAYIGFEVDCMVGSLETSSTLHQEVMEIETNWN